MQGCATSLTFRFREKRAFDNEMNYKGNAFCGGCAVVPD